MKIVFNFKRVGLLLKRYFFENLNRELLFWSIIIFTFTVLDNRIFVLLVMFVSGVFSSIRLQKDLMKDSNGMHYLLIPATISEKLASSIIINTIYHFVMTLLAYSIGNGLIIFTYHFILKLAVPVNWDLFQETSTINVDGLLQPIIKNVFWSVFGVFAFSQSLFMLGSLYFKKNVLSKTIFTILGIGFILFFLQLFIFKTYWHVKHLTNVIFPMFVLVTDFTIPNIFKTALVIGSYLLIPFMWIVSYFRLSEKEL